MAGPSSLAGLTLNPQLLEALRLVDSVRVQVQSLLPLAFRTGSVTVSEIQIRSWQTSLRSAIDLIASVPVIAIFPPPPVAQFIQRATDQLQQALAILDGIPIASLRIFPPQPGQGTIPLQTLRQLFQNLRLAELFLIAALQSA